MMSGYVKHHGAFHGIGRDRSVRLHARTLTFYADRCIVEDRLCFCFTFLRLAAARGISSSSVGGPLDLASQTSFVGGALVFLFACSL